MARPRPAATRSGLRRAVEEGPPSGATPTVRARAPGVLGRAPYRRFLSTALQQAIQSNDQASRLSFTAQVRVWIGPDGRIRDVAVARSSGDARPDRTLVAALMGAGRLDEPPPPNLKFPALVALRGRKA